MKPRKEGILEKYHEINGRKERTGMRGNKGGGKEPKEGRKESGEKEKGRKEK
jgi:hypothetical protein